MRGTDSNAIFRHPFVVVLAAVTIAYGGYLFGQ